MNPFDILILLLLCAAVFFALRSVFRRRGKGGCCGCCGNCDGCREKPAARPRKK